MFQSKELMSLMEEFYVLTGIRIVLFDEHYKELCSVPSGEDTFCSFLRKIPAFDSKCRECDAAFFTEGKRKDGVQIYRCHAGMTEASVPILQNSRIVGYLMFGQITSEKDKTKVLEHLTELCRLYGITDIPESKIAKVKYKNERQILAAAKILEACAEYVIVKDLIRRSTSIVDRIEAYIDEHLQDDLNAESLGKKFGISRTALYKLMAPYCSEGISAYIKRKRLQKAKQLIESTNRSLQEISEMVGFNDYNYFLRCFKTQFGHSSRYYRE